MLPIIDVVRITLTLTVISVIVWVIYRPECLKRAICEIAIGVTPSQYYVLSANGTEYGHTDGGYTIFRNSERKLNEHLLIWFGGGGMLFSDRRIYYGFLDELKNQLETLDILVFDYPVRLKRSVQDALIHADSLITRVVNQYGYTSFFAAAVSTGALLMGAYVGKQADRNVAKELNLPFDDRIGFRGIIGICGMYSTRFRSRFLKRLFEFYIMRGTPNPERYSCYNLPDMPKLIIGSSTDILRQHTYDFISANQCEKLLFSNQELPRDFISMLNFKETRRAMNEVRGFVSKLMLDSKEKGYK